MTLEKKAKQMKQRKRRKKKKKANEPLTEEKQRKKIGEAE
jgi:hypothetical protein